ncbi:MAG TPA: acyl carrier protein [Casimicrobiaceae bacterium]|nr:acyl carrier protein [Casimicrobiaceae bacterium]
MTTVDIRTTILDALSDVAPEMEREKIDPRVDLREQLDLDSMDFLNFVVGLHKAFGVDIPEADYRKIGTLDGCMTYLAAKARPIGVPSAAA